MAEHPPTFDEQQAQQRAAERLSAARHVTVLSGAGISTDSGLADFRGPQGTWTRDPGAQRLSDIASYEADPAVRRQVWRGHVETAASSPQPNAAHHALVELERAGRLRALVTQNVDGLHHAAGHDPATVIEVHGNTREAACLRCGERTPMGAVLERVRAGDDDPQCRSCGGLLKAATVSFGQRLPPDELHRAQQAAAGCDLLLAVGTSLVVSPVDALPQMALEAGARVVILNAQATPYDADADAVVRGPLSEVLPRMVAAAFSLRTDDSRRSGDGL